MITPTLNILFGSLGLFLFWYGRRSSWAGGHRIAGRILLGRLPLPMLALAASYGVYSYALLFVPWYVAATQAAAFELTYIGLAVSDSLDRGERRRAVLISAGAVVASIAYNTLAGWFGRQPQLLEQATEVAWLWLAVLHGAPLAWVAYLVADLLLHSRPRVASARLAQLRRLARRLARLLRSARATEAAATAMLAQAQADRAEALAAAQQAQLAQAQAEREQATAQAQAAGLLAEQAAQLEAQLAQADQQIARIEVRAAQAEADLAQANDRAERAAELLARQGAELREYEHVTAQLRADLSLASAATALDIVAIARYMIGLGAEVRKIAPLLGVPESTLRGRLKAQTNGHAIDG